jgi:UDP-N-acetylmuramyl tripeptide synthase
VGLRIDPGLLATLAAGRRVAVVSGTNGKTTTTRMLAAALTEDGAPPVATNATGANMPAGHVAALVEADGSPVCVLEVDEGYLGRVIEEARPRVVVLLNLSRDQLDRIAEVRMLVDRWRTALRSLTPPGEGSRGTASGEGSRGTASGEGAQGTVVVANADDPMVAWAASTAPAVRWVGAGQVWHHDAVGCPACGGRIEFGGAAGWACDRCEFARPEPEALVEGSILVLADGTRLALDIALPGQFNRSNAAMVAVAAPLMAADLTVEDALVRLSSVTEVAGRFASRLRSGHPVRLLLAKNPAGWTAILDLLDETSAPDTPVVLSINARTADGFDPSWLWDVPFERLAGRTVVATGDRYRDLAVRLRYAGVGCTPEGDPLAAVDRAVARAADRPEPGPVDVLGNYTAFADLRARL